jgi:hypothetical protein
MDTTTREQLRFPISVGEVVLAPTPIRPRPVAVVQDWEEARLFDPDRYPFTAVA